MANFIGMVYATLKNEGIDTKGMSTDEAVDKFKELQKSQGKSGKESEPTPAESRKLAEKGVETKATSKDGFDALSEKYDIINKGNIDEFIKDYNDEFGTNLSVDGNDILNDNFEDVYNIGKGAQVEYLVSQLNRAENKSATKESKKQKQITNEIGSFLNNAYDEFDIDIEKAEWEGDKLKLKTSDDDLSYYILKTSNFYDNYYKQDSIKQEKDGIVIQYSKTESNKPKVVDTVGEYLTPKTDEIKKHNELGEPDKKKLNFERQVEGGGAIHDKYKLKNGKTNITFKDRNNKWRIAYGYDENTGKAESIDSETFDYVGDAQHKIRISKDGAGAVLEKQYNTPNYFTGRDAKLNDLYEMLTVNAPKEQIREELDKLGLNAEGIREFEFDSSLSANRSPEAKIKVFKDTHKYLQYKK